MRRARWWLLALLGGFAVLGLLLSGSGGAASSTLNRGPGGWLGAARVLEEMDLQVQLLDRPVTRLDELLFSSKTPDSRTRDSTFSVESSGLRGDHDGESGGPIETVTPDREFVTLVIGFPWQRSTFFAPVDEIEEHLRGEGRLILAYDGQRPSPAETQLFQTLQAPLRERSGAVPLSPLRWWRQMRQDETHTVVRGATGDPTNRPPHSVDSTELHTGTLRWVPRAPEGAEVWVVDSARRPLSFAFRPALGGEVWVLPADSLANAYLRHNGNAELFLTIADALVREAGIVVFDEFHHGLLASGEGDEAAATRRTIDLFGIQLLLIYALAVLALAWRFGPSWPEQESPSDTHRHFLLGLGTLHLRLGHHREAARLLVKRQRLYDPSTSIPADVERRLTQIDRADFVRLARELSGADDRS